MSHETREEQHPTKSQAETRAASHARLILAVVISAAFLDVVDFSVVQVALPSIQREFRESLASAQWIIGVYGLTLAGFLMGRGPAGDAFGPQTAFLVRLLRVAPSSPCAGVPPPPLTPCR